MSQVMLGNDLVVNENDCNLSCEYCLTGQSNLKKEHSLKLIFEPPRKDEYAPGSPLQRRLDLITDRVQQNFSTPFLKITGGEIFLVKGMMDFIARESSRHEVVVVQTNGLLLRDSELQRLRELNNVVIQVSLDSHLHSGNSYRIAKKSLHDKALARVRAILESGISTEVYAVLNDRSIEEMEPFAEWLLEVAPQTVYFPFPVRGPDSERFCHRADQVMFVERFVSRYDEFAQILPPRPYFERLLSFFRDGERNFRCHVPRLVLSTFSDGVLTACPNIWFSDMGNVIDDEHGEAAVGKVMKTGLYAALLSPKPRLDACKKCYTPWDLLSMYFDDEITLDELCRSPTYRPANARRVIEEKKREYDASRQQLGPCVAVEQR